MMTKVSRVVVAAVLALALGCEGPSGEGGPAGKAGGQGPAGGEGPAGPGFEVGRSISGVQPNWVAQGRSQEVQISGYATDWATGAAPTVNFGEGVTHTEVTVASNSALLVRVTAEDGAPAGKRNFTVTSGGETLTFSAGFEVRRRLEATVIGETVRPSFTTIRVQSNDPELALAGADFSVTLPPGLTGGVFNVTPHAFLVYVLAGLDAPPGTADALIRIHPGSPLERSVTVPVTVTQTAIPTASGGTYSGTVVPYASSVFRFVPTVAAEMLLSVTTSTGVPPGAFVFASAGNALVAQPGDTFLADAGEEYFGIVYAFGGQGGPFTAAFSEVPTFTESEPNDDAATANAASGTLFNWSGEVSDVDLVDYVLVSAGVDLTGRRVSVKHIGPGSDADFTVEVLSPDGTASYGVSPNLYGGGTHVFQPLAGGDSYLMKISYAGFEGGTGIQVTVQ